MLWQGGAGGALAPAQAAVQQRHLCSSAGAGQTPHLEVGHEVLQAIGQQDGRHSHGAHHLWRQGR